ncbi:MAG: HU family DNA-binding protein [Bdellovibrionales bacterium]|nr:HU family DNA-binding protein [Bdellovibrionales bacterium]
MTKKELVEKLVVLHKKRQLSKAAAEDIIESLFHHLTFALKRSTRFSYPGFGTFVVRRRKARKARNPKTGEEITIKAARRVSFKPATDLKNRLN